MRHPRGSLSHATAAAAQEVPHRSHLRRVDVRQRRHTASE